jgi:hypothetical protein
MIETKLARSKIEMSLDHVTRVRVALDMDDSLEQPGASPDPIESSDRLDADEDNSSGDEDGGLDWTKLP